jgi:hypothetical protein
MHYDVAMPSLQIRELPADVYEALSERAKAEHRSLAQQAVVDLRRLSEPEGLERRRRLLAEIRERMRRGEGPKLSRPPEELIREERDR